MESPLFDIKLNNLTKKFDSFTAVNNINFTIPKSSVTVLLGPSGCGKTTLMRMIAGLEKPTSGSIFFEEHEVTRVSTRRRNLGMVFQYPVIYRGTSVKRNLELPLLSEGLEKQVINDRVHKVAELLGISDSLNKLVEELDNGTRQKIAVGRAIAREPNIILFDEPITNIDINSKLELKRSLKELFGRLSQTIVYVTHDQTEAMTLADQIALMQDGVITQCAPPSEIYSKPGNQFAGWFLGNPGMNFIDKKHLTKTDSTVGAPTLFSQTLRVGARARDVAVLGIRAESVSVSTKEVSGAKPARVLRKSLGIGGQYLLDLDYAGLVIKVRVSHAMGREVSDKVWTTVDSDNISLFDENGVVV
ncbi:MAG: ABC transporter ATP-binding protein [Actinobacteria bacterium]|nr:ABC transporter ATP-binding protein [Actinomycetota bacterium]NBP11887.1 ABC transporter ATP-binding protein [Actinomycetota bacterium]NBP42709.1 ABC transporter ATP-binding protein [Actinomycetota bacterium]NBQ66455.1 ABC transporter ATP-binding protein [Actinomycetota bacterium]NCU83546.1 ABC transporter ATP-binding protein [Actinomycetota bacterium]